MNRIDSTKKVASPKTTVLNLSKSLGVPAGDRALPVVASNMSVRAVHVLVLLFLPLLYNAKA